MPPEAAAPLMKAAGVNAGYGTMQVLWGVDLDVRPGETVLLLGANGAGKTTFLKSLVGLIEARSGSIINMSSVVGVRGNGGQSAYAASKAGIIVFTKSIAAEIGSRNIRCNAIAPGFIETDMTHYLKDGGAEKWFEKIPLGRFGKPEEVANAALFLASDMSLYITGQVLTVDGGMVM